MQNVTLPEMIAIVDNGAHYYKVTISVIGNVGTLVAASTDSNNVYTIQIPNLVDRNCYNSESHKHVYMNDELAIYAKGVFVIKIDNLKTGNIWNLNR